MSIRRAGAAAAVAAFLVAGGLSGAAEVNKTKEQRSLAKQADELNDGLRKLQDKGEAGPLAEFYDDGKAVLVRLRLEMKTAGGKPVAGLKVKACDQDLESDASGTLEVRCPVSDAPFKTRDRLIIVDLSAMLDETRNAYARGEEAVLFSPAQIGYVISMDRGRISWKRWERALVDPLAPGPNDRERDAIKKGEEILAPPVTDPKEGGTVVLEVRKVRSKKNAYLQAWEEFVTAAMSGDPAARKAGAAALAGDAENGLAVTLAALRDGRGAVASRGAEAAGQLGPRAGETVKPLLGLVNDEKAAAEARWSAMEALEKVGDKDGKAAAAAYRKKAEAAERQRKKREESDERIRTIPALGADAVKTIYRALSEKQMLDAGTLWARSEGYQKLDEFEKKRYRETRPEEIAAACAKIADEYLLTVELPFQDGSYDFKERAFKFDAFVEVTFGEGRSPGDVCELLLDRDVVIPLLRYTEAEAEALVKKKRALVVRIQVGVLAYRDRKMTEAERVNQENFQIAPPAGLTGRVLAVEFDFPDRELIYKKSE